MRFGSEAETSFTLFNFGKSPLHIDLKHTIPGLLKRTVIDITPTKTTLGYREKCEVKIRLGALDYGEFSLKLFYFLRLHKNSDKIIKGEAREIFAFDFECSWPIVQVQKKAL